MNAKMIECTNLLVMNPIDWTLNTVVLSPLSAHDLLSQLGLTYVLCLGGGGGGEGCRHIYSTENYFTKH